MIETVFDYKDFFGIVSGVLVFCSYCFYIAAIKRGDTKPNLASWVMLVTISSVLAVSYYRIGADETLYTAIGTCVGTALVLWFALAYAPKKQIRVFGYPLRYPDRKWSRVDIIFIVTAATCMLVYFVSRDPLLTLAVSMFMDLCAMGPTIYHAYKAPREEDGLAWTMTVAGDLFGIAAVKMWTFSTWDDVGVALYPPYMFLINGLVLVIILNAVPLRQFYIPYMGRRHAR
jgi:hypothetical protein